MIPKSSEDRLVHQRFSAPILLSLMAFVLLASFTLFYFSPVQKRLRLCDQAIRADLKAPATYDRVSGSLDYGQATIFSITYDAENSFGVPIRSSAKCSVSLDGASATWTAM